MMTRPKYEILTWDSDRDAFTPQAGVRRGPYTAFGLRKALRELRSMGYAATRFPRKRSEWAPGQFELFGCGDPSVLVQRLAP